MAKTAHFFILSLQLESLEFEGYELYADASRTAMVAAHHGVRSLFGKTDPVNFNAQLGLIVGSEGERASRESVDFNAPLRI